MKSIHLAISMTLSLFLGQGLFSQTWNNVYILDTDTFSSLSNNGIIYDSASDAIYGQMTFTSLLLNRQGTGFVKYNLSGEAESWRIIPYHADNFSFGRGNIMKIDENFVSLSQFQTSDSLQINWISKDFDSLKTWMLFDEAHPSFNFLKKLNSHQIMIGGSVNPEFYENEGKARLLVLDDSANIIQKITYSGGQFSNEFLDVQVDDEIIRVIGRAGDQGSGKGHFYQEPIIFDYDSNWNKIRQIKFPDSLRFRHFEKIIKNNESWLVAGTYRSDGYPDDDEITSPLVAELNIESEVSWKYIDTSAFGNPNNYMADIEIDAHGNIYGLALAFSRHDSTDLLNPEVNDEKWKYILQANLYKWNKDKELLWVRHIKHPLAKSFNSVCRPLHLLLLPDGSIVFSGYYIPGYYDDQSSWLAWLVRTDSNGCIEGQPCRDWNAVGISEPTSLSAKSFTVFPNPTADGILKTNLELSQFSQALIFANDGRLMDRPNIQNGTMQLKELPNGIYNLIVIDKSQMFETKIIISK